MVNESNQGQRAGAQFDDEIDLRELLGVILDGRHIIAVSVALFAAMAVVYALVATPIYRANGFMLVEDAAQGVPGLDDTAEIIVSDSSSATELFVIKSRTVVGKVVDELDLTTSAKPIYLRFIGEAMARRHSGAGLADAAFGLNSYAWGGEQIIVPYLQVPRGYLGQPLELIALGGQRFSLSHNGQTLLTGAVGEPAFGLDGGLEIRIDRLTARPGTRFGVKKSRRFDRILALQSALSISEKGKDSGIIEIALEGADREHISEIVDSVAANYHFQNVSRLAEEAGGSLAFLDQQIQGVRAELSRSEEALNDYKSEHSSVDLPLEAASVLDSLVQIEADISAMLINEAEISRRFMPEHPNYRSFKLQQEGLLRQRDKFNVKLAQLPDTQKKMLRLRRDFEASQAIFISLDKRRQELSILKASTVGNVRLLDSAGVMPDIVAPNPKLIIVLGSLLGGMLGFMIVALRFFLKAGIIDPKVLTDMGLTVHATIPYSENEISAKPTDASPRNFRFKEKAKNRPNYRLLAHDCPDDSSVEAIRSFRTCLRFLMTGARNNLVMISSGSPGVGKSFVSVNLGAVIAKSGQRVLIVDADMRKSYLHRTFGVSPENGLAEVLAGTLCVSDAVRETVVDNLYFMPRGEVPINPSELLMSPMITKLAEELSEAYDLVIFDTPPILAVTDSSIIGAHCGTNMMVARFETCTVKEIAAAKNRFNLNGVDIRGVIFNAVQKKAGSYYYDEVFAYGKDLGDYHKPPARARANMAASQNLLSPEELEALAKID
ncbi:polysaccharide biosynthesis tyrosine autokinase [Porticoccaceae bacterium]|nr:polysaccharide biosynthesis tyrosine autokinase [Porticoccaceae bacterium]